MPPVMRISEHNWERLKMWATPLEDSADDALGKVLDAAESKDATLPGKPMPDSDINTVISHQNSESAPVPYHEDTTESPNRASVNGAPLKNERIKRGQKVPQSAYELPILESLYSLGGTGHIQKVLDMVKEKMDHLFTDIDYQTLKSGSTQRWENTAQFARNALVIRGLLKPTEESGWGIWELTEEGVAALERNGR